MAGATILLLTAAGMQLILRKPVFRLSPLSLCVPLEGSDSVKGLSELVERRRFRWFEEAFGIENGKYP